MNPARKYDLDKVRELIIESIGDQFVDFYVMDIPKMCLRRIIIKTREEMDWHDDVVDLGKDKVSPYFDELFPLGAPAYPIYTTLGLKGGFVYVREGLFD